MNDIILAVYYLDNYAGDITEVLEAVYLFPDDIPEKYIVCTDYSIKTMYLTEL